MNEERDPPHSAEELIGYDSSALSLDGRSLNIPNDGTDEDVSSLGTSKYGGYKFFKENAVGYIGNMRIIGRAPENDIEDGPPVPSFRSPTPSPYHHYSKEMSAGGEYDFQRTDYSVQTEDRGGTTTLMEEKEDGGKDNKKRSGYLPDWIVGAPFWLKLVIICSTALLIGAVVLIAVGANLAKDGLRSSSGDQHLSHPSTPVGFTPPPGASTYAPTSTIHVGAPVAPGVSTFEPTSSQAESSPPVEMHTDNPTVTTGAPESSPSVTSFNSTSLSPSSTESSIHGSTNQVPLVATVNFFAIGGRYDGEALAALTEDLQTLPNIDGNTVMFHLGDWNSPYATSCVESSFTQNVEIYQQSSVPVYFLLGDNEFNGTTKQGYRGFARVVHRLSWEELTH
jgi:hypothetical protein